MAIHLSPDKPRAAELLLSIQAVLCNTEKPFILTSGRASPVYVDCRRIISFLDERREIVRMMADLIRAKAGALDVVAGGETAGIPFAAWISEALDRPMIYVRKKPKEGGRMEQIEGKMDKGRKAILVEDLASDAGSKVKFCEALRREGAVVSHSAVVFYYGNIPAAAENLRKAGVDLLALTDWATTVEVAESRRYFTPHQARTVREFLTAPDEWSKKRGTA